MRAGIGVYGFVDSDMVGRSPNAILWRSGDLLLVHVHGVLEFRQRQGFHLEIHAAESVNLKIEPPRRRRFDG